MFDLFLVMMALASPVMAIMLVSRYLHYKAKVKRSLHSQQSKLNAQEIIGLQEQVAELSEKIVVLEKIVITSQFELNQQIQQL